MNKIHYKWKYFSYFVRWKYWTIRRWWHKPKSEMDIYYVLSHDQCHYGFTHTVDELMGWLYQCTLDGSRELHNRIGEHIREADEMFAAGHPWHHDDRQFKK